jgi:PAS domain S-box-containing protein
MQQDDNGQLRVGPHAVFALDTSGRCTHSTGPALAYMGLRPGQLVGTDLFELYRDDPFNVAALRRVLAGESFNVEREFQGRLLSTYFEPARDIDGLVTGGLGVTTDITEQRRIEGQLREARERASLLADVSAALSRELLDPEALLRTAVRSVTDALADLGLVWVRAKDERYLAPGAAWRSQAEAGRSNDTWLPSSGERSALLDVSVLEAMSGPRLYGLDAAESGFLFTAERCGATSGLRVPLRSRGTLLGVLDLARGSAWDTFTEQETDLVTEIAERCALALDHALLLEAHREAREELVKFEALAEASDNLIGISDIEDRLVYTNPRVRASGLDLAGGVWDTVEVASVDGTVQDAMRRGLESAGRWSGDVTAVAAGSSLTVNLAAFRLFHPDTGAPLGTAWIGQDVTELRATEAALRGANSDLMRFKALVDASPDFIAIATTDGTVQYLNPGGRMLIGTAPGVDVTSTKIGDYATPEGPVSFDEQVMPEVFARGHWEGESTLRNHRGGPPIRVATSTFLVKDAETHEPFALATVQRDITDRLAAETALRGLAEQRQALLTRLVDAQDAERTRIAADVHDDQVQVCAAVDLRLGLLRRQVRERAPELLEGLDVLQATVSGATGRLRALLFDLEPPDLEQGLAAALYRAAEEIFESTEIRWNVLGDQEPDVPDTTRTIAYRIAKEAMINARKHAGASHVGITVAGREGGLEVSIDDDGVGLGSEPMDPSPGHRGLLNMQDRATVAGGRCTVHSGEVGGTVVTVWLPGPPPAAASDS